MKTFFQNNNSNELILFFDGWGMDEKPYAPLKSSSDVLFVYDYNDLTLNFDFSKYKKIILIAFSAGVFISSFIQDKLPKTDLKIAINGVPNLFDAQKGIPTNILNEMESITLENALEFRKKFISEESHLKIFNKNQPLRPLDSSLKELLALKKYSAQQTDSIVFDKVIIGDEDEIIPIKNQISAWSKYEDTHMLFLEGGHFLFYLFKIFDEIIDL